MYHYPFVTFERPHCLYDWRLPELNQEFLGRFDPDYFIHLTEAVYQTLEGDNEKRASVAMRTAYHHGLETFFSLLAACVQAPECIIGWLHKYRNDELRECIRCITERRSLMNRHGFPPPPPPPQAGNILQGSSYLLITQTKQKLLSPRNLTANYGSVLRMNFFLKIIDMNTTA